MAAIPSIPGSVRATGRTGENEIMTVPLARTTAPRVEQAGLWHALATVLRPGLNGLAEQILGELQRQIPEYARPHDRRYMASVKRGVEEALHQFVDQIADPAVPQKQRAEVYRAFGRHEMREGRSLDSLQRAYRLGGRMGWRHFMSVGARAELPRRSLLLLGEAILTHIDELAALSVEGYAEAQGREVGVLARRRRQLLDLLLSDPPVTRRMLEEAAAAAQWELPAEIVVVALQPPAGGSCGQPTLPSSALADLEGGDPLVLVPVDEEPAATQWTEAQWERHFPGWRIVLSAQVPLEQAAHVLHWGRRVLTLVGNGVVPAQPVIRCDHHLTDVLLLNNEPLVRKLAEHRLAPLRDLRPKQRIRLARTLLSWLQARGGAPEVAAQLDIHPQTVRYRLRQLEELFGSALRDPDERFGLEMALRGMALFWRDEQNQPLGPPGPAGEETPTGA